MNWFRKKKTAVEIDTTFMDVIEMFFIKHTPLIEVKRAVNLYTGCERVEADKALRVIVLSADPSRDTVLLLQAMAKLDRVIDQNGELRSRVVRAESDAASRLGFINAVEFAIGELK